MRLHYVDAVCREGRPPSVAVLSVADEVSVRWVTLFPLGSLLLLLLADVIAIIGHWTSRRALNFLSGILSVIGGTCT